MTTTHRVKCGEKVRYASHAKAEQARVRITSNLGRFNHASRPQRSYECPTCKGFHLTSYPKLPKKSIS
jgi:hypothetical protein